MQDCKGVKLQSLNHSSQTVDVEKGYEDFSCDQFTILNEGLTYPMEFEVGSNSNVTVAVYIDKNNDGDLDTSEQVLQTVGTGTIQDSITIDSGYAKNTWLRMRVINEKSNLGISNACETRICGQAEDYRVWITDQNQPPILSYTLDTGRSCTGYLMYNLFVNGNNRSYSIDFGDGNSSTTASGTYRYTQPGTYDLLIKACNDKGCDSTLLPQAITVQDTLNLPPLECEPQTIAHCCDVGVSRVVFGDINNPTQSGIASYEDFTCQGLYTFNRTKQYNLGLKVNEFLDERVRIAMDYNNNGYFEDNEYLFKDSSIVDSAVFTIDFSSLPNTAYEHPMRLRITTDAFAGGSIDSCGNSTFGQSEDYAILATGSSAVVNRPHTDRWHLFPNPAQNRVYIEAMGSSIDSRATLRIFNLQGQEVLSKEINQQSMSIPTNQLPSGTYLIQIMEPATGLRTHQKLQIAK